MNFINPFLLLFAAAASIPLLLHLFNRQRVKIVEFSTVKYLLSLQKTRMRKVRIRQILLLILRTLALLAIAFAFARPTIKGGYLPSLGGKSTTTAILLLDVSGSSMSETNAGSFFERSIEKATQILGNFTEKERVEIIGFGSTILYDSGEPTSDYERLKALLKSMQPSFTAAVPTVAFVRALEVLKSSNDPNLEVYLLSDLQGQAWRNFEFELFQTEHLDVKLFITRVSPGAIDNVSVEQVKFPNQLITAGREFSSQCEVHNFKSETSADLLVSLDLNDKTVVQTDLTVAPAATGKVTFKHNAPSSGFMYGAVSIDDDDLLPDNRFNFAMKIPSSSKVALVSDDDQEAFYVQKALSPSAGGNFTKQVDLIGTLQASTANLFGYDAVIVNLKGQMPAALVSSLRGYVNSGGAVLFMMRPNIDLRDFSDKIASPIFRLQVTEAPPAPTPQAGKYLLNKFDFDHPLFSPYKQFTADKLPQAEFLGHFRTAEEASTRVLARFSDNMPAVLEGTVGKGKALLYTFSLDSRFSDLVNRPFMVILLNRSIEYLVSEPLNQRENIVSGMEVTRELSAQNARQFILVTPANDTTQLSPAFRTGAVVFNLGRLQNPGIYKIIGDGAPIDVFAVNFPPEESETAYSEPATVGKKVAGAKVIVLDYGANPTSLITSARFGTELWKLFLLIGFIFLMIEMAIAYGGKQTEVVST
jgi:hypothetical protein